MKRAVFVLLVLGLVAQAPGPGTAWAGVFSAAENCGPSVSSDKFRYGNYWLQLSGAEACAAAPGIGDARRARAFRDAGTLRFLLGDSVGAELAFRSALKLAPGDAAASFRLAQALRDRPEAALAYAEQAAREGATPRSRAAAWRLRAEIQLDLGDAAGAKVSVERSLALDGDDLDAIAVSFRTEGAGMDQRAASAQRAFRAAQAAPVWCRPEAYLLSARLSREAGEPAGALRSLALALELEPNDVDALRAAVEIEREAPQAFALASASFARPAPAERPADAAGDEKETLRALAAEPEDLEALRRLIVIRLGQKRAQEAEELVARFMDAVTDAPPWQQLPALRLIGRLSDARRAAQAAEVLTAAHTNDAFADPRAISDPGLFLEIASDRAQLGDGTRAEESAKAALALAPGHCAAATKLAEFELADGRFQPALDDAERAVSFCANAPPAQLSAALRQKARAQLALQDESGAEQSLARALAGNPADGPALKLLGELKLAAEKPGDALKLAERRVKASGAAEPKERADAFLQEALAQRALQDDVGAEKSLARALSVDPGDAAPLEAMADLLLDETRCRDARSCADRLVQACAAAEPENCGAAFRLKARAQLCLGDDPGADNSLAAAFLASPLDARNWEIMADLRRARGRLSAALEAAELRVRASRGASAVAAALVQRAQIQADLKDKSGAEASYALAAKTAPDDFRTIELFVEFRAADGRPREAMALLQGRHPVDGARQAPWLVLRGLAHSALGERSGAQDDFAAAVKTDASVCFSAMFSRDRLPVSFFDRCLRRFPDDSTLFSDRGVARYVAGDVTGAAADFRKALSLKPENLEARLSLASALVGQGLTREASAELDGAPASAEDRDAPLRRALSDLRKSLRDGRNRPRASDPR